LYNYRKIVLFVIIPTTSGGFGPIKPISSLFLLLIIAILWILLIFIVLHIDNKSLSKVVLINDWGYYLNFPLILLYEILDFFVAFNYVKYCL